MMPIRLQDIIITEVPCKLSNKEIKENRDKLVEYSLRRDEIVGQVRREWDKLIEKDDFITRIWEFKRNVKLMDNPNSRKLLEAIDEHGVENISALSRATGLSRTTIYRYLPDLVDNYERRYRRKNEQ